MATAPRKQVSHRLAALALACLAQAALGGRPAAAQPPSLSCIHTTAVAAYAASVSQSAPAMRALQRAQSSTAHQQRPAPTEPAQPAPPRAEQPAHASTDVDAARESERTPATAPAAGKRAETKSSRASAPKAAHAPVEPKQPPPLPSILERLGGEHAKRAMQVAQGVPAGRVALRPMFWMTRDQRGGMVALGGRF